MKKLRLTKEKIWLIALFISLTSLGQNCKVIYDVDFNNHNNDTRYEVSEAKSDFGNIKPYTGAFYRGLGVDANNRLVDPEANQVNKIINGSLRAQFKANDAGGKAGGFLFDPYFTGVEEAYLEYRVKFDSNFVWASGGKLPGLGGSTEGKTSETVGRGKIPSGGKYDETGTGFSARFMWRRNRSHSDPPYLILYSYFAKKQDGSDRKNGNFGDGYRVFSGEEVNGKPVGLKSNTWYKIKQYIKLNTPGQSNGIVKIWINGSLKFNNSRMNIRKSGKSDLKINALVMNTYRGGSRTDQIWHSSKTEYAFFDDFKVWTGCENFPDGSSSNTAPQVSINEPINNKTFSLGETINLVASATDDDKNLQKVNFKINGDFYKTDSKEPYSATFTPTSVGTYTISAKAFDTEGLTNEKKATINVVQQAPANQAPTVFISEPSDGSSYELGNTINLAANATDADGNLEKINFKVNSNFYSTHPNAPYANTFTPTAVGTYTISAKAFDVEGLTNEKIITITVEEPAPNNTKPSVNITAPADGSTFEIGEVINLRAIATDVDDNIEKINFKIDDNFYRTSAQNPYNTTFTPQAIGTYKIAARAFDTDGLSEEEFVTVNIVNPAPDNQAPVVTVSAPADGSIFELGQTIDISSIATDVDNNLEKINFKINDNYYRTSASSPFNTTYTPQAVGTYKIAARAFDTNGLFEEKFVTISIVEPAPVNQAPVVTLISPEEGSVFTLGETISLSSEATDADMNLERINFKIDDNFYQTSTRNPFNALFTPQEVGTYKIAARAVDTEGASEEKFVTISVVAPEPINQAPVVSVISPEDGSAFTIGETINLSAQASDVDGNLEKINFKVNDQFYQTSARNPSNTTFTPQAVGTYKIAARAFDTDGLSEEKFVTITVTASLSNSIFSKESTSVNVYPNPAKNVINMTGTNKDTTYSIVDISGKIIQRAIIENSNPQLDISNFVNGIYFIKLYSETGVKTISFIKQ